MIYRNTRVPSYQQELFTGGLLCLHDIFIRVSILIQMGHGRCINPHPDWPREVYHSLVYHLASCPYHPCTATPSRPPLPAYSTTTSSNVFSASPNPAHDPDTPSLHGIHAHYSKTVYPPPQ